MKTILLTLAILMCGCEVMAQDSVSVLGRLRWIKENRLQGIMSYEFLSQEFGIRTDKEAEKYFHDLELAEWLESTGYIATEIYFRRLSDSIYKSYLTSDCIREARETAGLSRAKTFRTIIYNEKIIKVIKAYSRKTPFDGFDFSMLTHTIIFLCYDQFGNSAIAMAKINGFPKVSTMGRAPCILERE